MRVDMAKIIVERPRRKTIETRADRTRDLEDLPTHEGMRRGHALRGDRKELNENLAPLRRYIASQVGRPWNKIYSELTAHLRADSTVQQHVRDHLRNFVAMAPRLSAGGALWQGGNRLSRPFFVNPVTGTLRRTDQLPIGKARRQALKNRPAPPIDRCPVGENREFRRIKGLWFEVRLETLPEPSYRGQIKTVKVPLRPYRRDGQCVDAEMIVRRLVTALVYDVVTECLIATGPSIDTPNEWRQYRRDQPLRHYAVSKRVLSRCELRRHGLSNAVDEEQ